MWRKIEAVFGVSVEIFRNCEGNLKKENPQSEFDKKDMLSKWTNIVVIDALEFIKATWVFAFCATNFGVIKTIFSWQ